MQNSTLLSAILRGKWFIRESDAAAQAVLIAKLMNGGFSSEVDSRIYSETKPFSIMLDNGHKIAANPTALQSAPSSSTAIIPLHGTMLKYGTMCNYGTEEIAAAVRNAANSPNINSIVIEAHSGGGAVDAIAPLLEEIKKANALKPVVACCDLTASAAYYALLPCAQIIASNNISAEFGSIGVVMTLMDMSAYYESMGVKQHTIYSSLSESKNQPFELAKAGNYDQIITQELDPLALHFQNAVRQYRGAKLLETTPGLLTGKMFFAEEATRVGLIDSVGSLDLAVAKAQDLTNTRLFQSYIHSKS